MSKRRIVFSKTGMGKYISHLDLLRCFTRAIRRSGLPVEFSQGFHPHMKITFSLPLPIGVTGLKETADIVFADGVTDEEIMERLNRNLPMDMTVVSVTEPTPVAAKICAASYTLCGRTRQTVTEADIKAFFDQKEVLVLKKTKKKGEQQVNLMEFVRDRNWIGAKEGEFSFTLLLDAGGTKNCKPDLVTAALAAFLQAEDIDFEAERTEIYYERDGALVPFV